MGDPPGFTASVRDLDHRFVIDGRAFHVHVVFGEAERRPTMISNNEFDVAVFTCTPSEFADFDCDEPHKIALQIVERVSAFLPAEPSPQTLDAFHETVLDWIMQHRDALKSREK